MTKLDEAIKALELFPNMSPEIRDYLLAPIIEEQERAQLRAWLKTARNSYKHRLEIAVMSNSVRELTSIVKEIEAYIDRL